MNEVIRFALLGLGVGALYALASQGLIVIYRGTGVLNFSLGATAIAGVFMQWELQNGAGWPFLLSAVAGVAWSAFLGATHPLGGDAAAAACQLAGASHRHARRAHHDPGRRRAALRIQPASDRQLAADRPGDALG